MEIRVPQVAEGIDNGTVVKILVKEGDTVQANQDVVELETKKAVAPVPAPGAGKVAKIHVKEGDEVAINQLIMTLQETGAAASAPKPAAPAPQKSDTAVQQPATRPAAIPAAPRESAPSAGGNGYTYESKSGFPPPASPSIRKMAQEIGLDLTRVKGSESGGRINLNDIKAYIGWLQQAAFQGGGAQASAAPAAPAPAKPVEENIDFSKWGPVKEEALSPIRKVIYQRMTESWTTIPHVTQYEDADITRIMELKEKFSKAYEKKGAKLTVTSFVLFTLVQVLKRHPRFNCSITSSKVVYKDYINLGIAVDTESGLMVPVLKDAHKKSILDLSKDIVPLVERARARKSSMDELQGGTFTVSNQGGIGGGYFTPIINKPEVAILGISQARVQAVYAKKAKNPEPRTILPLCLSYDHRIIDGANAVRFITDLKKSLEEFNEKDAKI